MYLDWRRMIPLGREEINKLQVGDKLYFISDYDEVNSFKDTQGNKRPFHKVCYNATVETLYPNHIELWCEPIPETIRGWTVWTSFMQGHRESISRTEGCEMSKVHLYHDMVWDYEEDGVDDTELYDMPKSIKNATLKEENYDVRD